MTKLVRLNAVEPAEEQRLPSVVIVLSSDGFTWAKEWGAKEFYHGKEDTPYTREIFNINQIDFGPYKPGMSIPHYLALLNQRGQQITEWIIIGGFQYRNDLFPGDILTFHERSLKIILTVERNFTRTTPEPEPEAKTNRALEFLRKQIGR